MYRWFSILGSRRLSGRAKKDDDEYISDGDWGALLSAFICEFELSDLQHKYLVAVDAFPLLYELMIALEKVQSPEGIEVILGEGWILRGLPTQDGVDIRVEWETVTLRQHFSSSELALFLTVKIAEIISSLEKLDVDVESYMARFPPKEYQRGFV